MNLFPRGAFQRWRAAILWGGLLILAVWGISQMIRMPGKSHSGPLPALTEEELGVQERLRAHVRILAGEIGERNLWRYEALGQASRYIQSEFEAVGLPGAFQEYSVNGKPVRNVEASIPGISRPEEVLVIGAHYDSVQGSPGANDNATGTAAVLEVARLLSGKNMARSVRLVAFVNEEPPFFQTRSMGSRVYAKRARARGDRIIGMFSVETIGSYSDRPGSQQYPFPFGLFYPRTGDFIGFVGNLASRPLVRRSLELFRESTRFPSEGVAAPGWFMGIGWSDHWAFWKEGYSAVMVTDTALYRYSEYHTQDDLPDRINYEKTARVVVGLARMVEQLAGLSALPQENLPDG
jgi:hypothetical protein